MDPLSLLALFGPLIKSGGQALINKLAKGAQFEPANVDEAVKLMEAETNALKVRSTIGDSEGPTYPWVVGIVKLQRPVIVYGTITAFLAMSFFTIGTGEERMMVGKLAQIVIYWLFGERTLMHLQENR